MEKPSFDKKIEFIQEHARQIIPVLEDEKEKNKVEELAAGEDKIIAGSDEEKNIEQILEKFETKVFLVEKKEGQFDAEAKKILFGLSHPSPLNIVEPILERLKDDRRCRALGLITDNVAGVSLENVLSEWQLSPDLTIKSFKGGQIRYPGEKAEYNKDFPVLADVLETVKDSPYDVALTLQEGNNSPANPLFFSAKSVLGAKKSYLIFDGWTGADTLQDFFENKQRESIDGIFCADEMAKEILRAQLLQFPPEKIFITGLPIIDGLEISKADQYRQEGRQKLGIEDDEAVVLYLGDVSGGDEYEGVGDRDDFFNEKTAGKTVQALADLAAEEPERKFTLLVRPHPRDSRKEETLAMAGMNLAPNLKIISASKEAVSMQEAAYAADSIVSIGSTENFLAPLRGKPAVFLGYGDKGLGGDILNKTLGKDLIKLISEKENLSFISSEAELIKVMKQPGYFNRREPSAPAGNSINKILDIIFEEKNAEIKDK